MPSELLKLVLSRRFLLGSATWTLLALVVVNLMVLAWQRSLAQASKENLLIADISEASGETPRDDKSVGEKLGRYLPHVPDAAANRLVIVAGMSQMYAINDREPGDKTVSELLDDALRPMGTRVFGLAAPNLCNEEALFLLLATLESPRTKPHVFVFGACFDKFRNMDLRPSYLAFMKDRPGLQQSWESIAGKHADKYPMAAAKMRSTLTLLQTDGGQNESSFESRLQESLGRFLPLVGSRRQLSSMVQRGLYQVRNELLGIKVTSKRPILRSRYEMNKQFLALLTDTAREHQVQMVTYVNPLNPQAENPYIPEEYREFKEWLESFCRETGTSMANLEYVVPESAWGQWLEGPDFKHFRGAGHRATAAAILRHFGPLLVSDRTRGTRIR